VVKNGSKKYVEVTSGRHSGTGIPDFDINVITRNVLNADDRSNIYQDDSPKH
jgi:hypothetical protein